MLIGGGRRYNPNDPPPKFKYIILLPHFTILSFMILLVPGMWKDIRKYPHNEVYIFWSGVTIVFGSGLCLTLKFLCYVFDKKMLPDEHQKCRRDLLIGYGGIAICGVVPQAIALFVGSNKEWGKGIFTTSLLTAYLFPALLYPLFIVEHLRYYEINKTKWISYQRFFVILLQTVFYVIVIALVMKFDCEECPKFIFCGTSCNMFFCPGSTAEWFVIWKNGVWTRNDKGQTQEIEYEDSFEEEDLPKPVPMAICEVETADETASQNPFECQICLAPYSDIVTPMMLVGCGHTICEKCAAELTKTEQHTFQVICPFCRKPTRVPGGLPSELPKNYAAMERADKTTSRDPFECQICLAPYSNLVTPRMLVGCGHTVCEKCVAQFPRNEQFTAQVICPFCRKPTRMPCGLPSELPKNYAAMGGNFVKTDKC